MIITNSSQISRQKSGPGDNKAGFSSDTLAVSNTCGVDKCLEDKGFLFQRPYYDRRRRKPASQAALQAMHQLNQLADGERAASLCKKFRAEKLVSQVIYHNLHKQMGLPVRRNDWHILARIISFTPAEHWSQDGNVPFFAHNAKLTQATIDLRISFASTPDGKEIWEQLTYQYSEKTVEKAISRLVQAGLLVPMDSKLTSRHGGNSKYRWIGYCLSIYRERLDELYGRVAKAKEDITAKREAETLKRRIRNRAKRLAQTDQDMASAALQAVGTYHRQAIKQHGYCTSQVLAILHDVWSHIAPPDWQPKRKTSQKTAGSIKYQSIYNNNPITQSEFEALHARAREFDPPGSQFEPADPSDLAWDEDQSALVGAYQDPSPGVQATHAPMVEASIPPIELLRAGLSRLKQTFGLDLRSWDDLHDAMPAICRAIGYRPQYWTKARAKIGLHLAASIVAVTAEKLLAFAGTDRAIQKPTGYINACVRRAVTGELDLNASLIGRMKHANTGAHNVFTSLSD